MTTILLLWAVACLLFVLMLGQAHRFNTPAPVRPEPSNNDIDEVINEFENSMLREFFQKGVDK